MVSALDRLGDPAADPLMPRGSDDDVSGLPGPVFWDRVLSAELARAGRYARPVTVVLVEVEGIADLHRDWGIEVTRRALHEAGGSLRRMARTSDHSARIGIGRFGVVLTETDEIAAINFIERVRDTAPGSMPRVASSLHFAFGWVSPKPGEPADQVMRRAERRLRAELLTPDPEPAEDPTPELAADERR